MPATTPTTGSPRASRSATRPDGLTLNAHYTWSKNLSGTAGDGWQYYNWGLTKAPTSFDTRHRFILQGMYDLPVGQGPEIPEQRAAGSTPCWAAGTWS